MTPHKFLSKICVSPTIHVSWPNLAKIGRCEVAEKSSGIADKKTGRLGHFLAPHFAPLSRSRPKFRERCRPLTCACTDFGPDRLRFAGLIPQRVQKSDRLSAYKETLLWQTAYSPRPLTRSDRNEILGVRDLENYINIPCISMTSWWIKQNNISLEYYADLIYGICVLEPFCCRKIYDNILSRRTKKYV